MLCIDLTHCFKIDICPKLAYLDHCRLFAIKFVTPHAMVFKITLLEVEGKINLKYLIQDRLRYYESWDTGIKEVAFF